MSMEIGKETITFDVSLICGSFDAPCKAACQNIMQFNGFFSCHYCEHPGKTIEKRVKYPIRENDLERNHEHALQDMKEASISGQVVKGFKGYSVLALAPDFDVIFGFAIDAMHSDYLGITKALCSSWLDSENHIHDFYIGRLIQNVNDNISRIKLFSQCDRNPRTISERHNWKANEWRDWSLHFSVGVLYKILPDRFLQNYGKFISSLLMLCSKKVGQVEIDSSKKLIENFRKDYQTIYGENKMTYNQHTLSHLPKCVEKLGPVWNYSNFPFESNNGALVNYVKSPKGVTHQIQRKYISTRYIETEIFSQTVSEFKKNISKGYNILSVDGVLGAGQPLDINCIAKFNTKEINFSSSAKFVEYSKFLMHQQMYTTKSFSSKIKTNDSAIKLDDGQYGEIVKIFKKIDEKEIFCLVKIHQIDLNHFIGELSKNYAVIDPSKDVKIEIISEKNIKTKCVFIDLEHVQYFSEQIIFYDHC